METPAPICQHPVRDGEPCVGPFLENLGTSCGLWEQDPQSHLIPSPRPQSQRSRREGYDLQRVRRPDRWR